MNTNFVVNDYILIWNLLFGTSITESIYKLKQKIWKNYKNEYNSIFKDKDEILKDYKNFIPNNDDIYNIVMDNEEYKKLKKEAEKYRLELMKIWDKNKKETNALMKDIIRIKIPDYNFFIINKELNRIDGDRNGNLLIGKNINPNFPLSILLKIAIDITNRHLKNYKEEDKKFKNAIVELAIINEYGTRLTGKSCYQNGSSSLMSLKRWLYPYWLMYLGVEKDKFLSYMMRDQIAFEVDKYAYEKQLKKMNLEEFIDFCIRNQRYIVRETKEEREERKKNNNIELL